MSVYLIHEVTTPQAFDRLRRAIAASGLDSDWQGIVHVIGPELGLTQPGMTIACGDSHTSAHGAFGAIAFGIGTSQVRALVVDVMEVGFPVASDDDACAVELIARDVRGPVLTALGRCNLADIELVGEIIRGETAAHPHLHRHLAPAHAVQAADQSVPSEMSRFFRVKHSGRHAVKRRCEGLGFDLGQGEVERVYREVIALADRGRSVGDDELVAIVKRR